MYNNGNKKLLGIKTYLKQWRSSRMKKNLVSISVMFLGLSIIISSYIISKSLSQITNMSAVLDGSLSVINSDSDYNTNAVSQTSDILQAYDAGVILGYEDYVLIQFIRDGKLNGLPYIDLGDHFIFSKKALEEWVYKNSIK